MHCWCSWLHIQASERYMRVLCHSVSASTQLLGSQWRSLVEQLADSVLLSDPDSGRLVRVQTTEPRTVGLCRKLSLLSLVHYQTALGPGWWCRCLALGKASALPCWLVLAWGTPTPPWWTTWWRLCCWRWIWFSMKRRHWALCVSSCCLTLAGWPSPTPLRLPHRWWRSSRLWFRFLID